MSVPAAGRVKIRFNMRPHQLEAYRARKRFDVRVWHRRAGKTFSAVSELLIGGLEAGQLEAPLDPPHRGYYVGPTFAQAKSIAWDYLRRFTEAIPGIRQNESELRVDFPGSGARLQLLGAENYNRLRGLYADDIVLDETALVPREAWTQVILPMLADRQGRALVQGTPMGRMNLFFDLWQEANDEPGEWSRSLLRVDETGVLDPAEVARLKRRMSEAEFAQEMLCSWDAALQGSFWGTQMAALEAAGRVTTVRADRALPVFAAVDLGWSDTMVVGFAQMAGTEFRILDCRAYEFTSIPQMVETWRELPFRVQTVVLPHDAKVTELGTGRTRQETFHALGCSTVICPDVGLHEGIEQVRQALEHVWFDREHTRVLREACIGYRSELDSVRGVHRRQPLHSWESHYADMLRYLVVGRPAHLGGWADNSALYDELERGVI